MREFVFQYQALAEPVSVSASEVTQLDKWYCQNPEFVRTYVDRRYLYPSFFPFNATEFDLIPFNPIKGMGFLWRQPDRVDRLPYRAHLCESFFWSYQIPTTPTVLVSNWYVQHPSWVADKLLSYEIGPYLAWNTSFTVETVTLDKWYQQNPEQVTRQNRHVSLTPSSFWNTFTPTPVFETITVDKWYIQNPSWVSDKLLNYPIGSSLAWNPNIEPTTVDRWYVQNPEFVRKAENRNYLYFSAFHFPKVILPEVVTCDKWMGSYPVRIDGRIPTHLIGPPFMWNSSTPVNVPVVVGITSMFLEEN